MRNDKVLTTLMIAALHRNIKELANQMDYSQENSFINYFNQFLATFQASVEQGVAQYLNTIGKKRQELLGSLEDNTLGVWSYLRITATPPRCGINMLQYTHALPHINGAIPVALKSCPAFVGPGKFFSLAFMGGYDHKSLKIYREVLHKTDPAEQYTDLIEVHQYNSLGENPSPVTPSAMYFANYYPVSWYPQPSPMYPPAHGCFWIHVNEKFGKQDSTYYTRFVIYTEWTTPWSTPFWSAGMLFEYQDNGVAGITGGVF